MKKPFTNHQLKFLVYGMGAIGSYIGGSLLLSGQKVAFIERKETADSVAKNGLILSINQQKHSLSNPVIYDSLEKAFEAEDYDILIFALKAFDTDTVLSTMQPYAEKMPPILCIQNGIGNEEKIGELFGANRVIAGSVTSAIGKVSAGNVVLEKMRGIGIAAGHNRSQQLVDIFCEAGLNAKLYPNPQSMKWSKMITNLLGNATSAILDLTPTEIYSNLSLYQIEVEQIRETLKVMSRQNIRVTNLPGTPVRLLAFILRYLPAKLSQPFAVKMLGEGRGAKMPSFHIDLHSGRGKSEVEYLNGAVYKAGKKVGVKTPINFVLNDTLMKLTNGELELQDFKKNPQALIDRMAAIREK